MNPTIPTGDSTQIVQGYYSYLLSTHHLGNIPIHRATEILWTSPFKIWGWWMVLVVTFFLYTYTFNRVHRRRGELYGATTFAGSILERNGRVSWFTWWIIGGLFLVALYLGVKYIFVGYLY